jgi:tRNA dimethylallyltransferase
MVAPLVVPAGEPVNVAAPELLLLVLLGPTASGKTALSLELAARFAGEIVSCDSVAVYRQMEIGTAKPTRAERTQLPHHLIDVVFPNETYTAGDYSREARAALAEITRRGHLPIVTGGTGLYLRALIEGLFAGPQRSQEVRDRLRRSEQLRGAGWLHRILKRLDEEAAERIHANDQAKLIRAIEVTLGARQPISEAWKTGRDRLTGYRIVRIGLDPDRAALYDRINARAARMFEQGLVEETEQLIADYGEDLRPLTSLGYRQATQILRGEILFADAVASAQQGHRNYAKRQMTWFRREPDVVWLTGFGDDAQIRGQAIEAVEAHLLSEPTHR